LELLQPDDPIVTDWGGPDRCYQITQLYLIALDQANDGHEIPLHEYAGRREC
jgi:hypothetical protein